MSFSFERLSLHVLIAISAVSFTTRPASSKDISIESLKGKSGTAYHLYQKNDLDVAWEIKRPDKSNPKIKLCIPAAFTTTTGTVVGIYACKGKVGNSKGISKSIGGAILINDGKFSIFPTSNGSIFTKDFVASLKERNSCLFQQFQLVTKGLPAGFKDKSIFQMRAIAKFKDGREGIVESDKAISFKTFNTDLVAMGVEDALYTDMGAWDEGWYRDPQTAALIPIGNDRSKTSKQTNWFIFFEP